MSKKITFEYEDVKGTISYAVYTVPGEAPDDLTEGEAEELDPFPPIILNHRQFHLWQALERKMTMTRHPSNGGARNGS